MINYTGLIMSEFGFCVFWMKEWKGEKQLMHLIENGKRIFLVFLVFLVISGLALAEIIVQEDEHPVRKDGWYSSMEEVAVYLTRYRCLPGNFITKGEAKTRGWVSSRGNLWDVAQGCSIGGDRYGNYEGQLPDARGRKWTECDIDFRGGRRGNRRILYSNDGLIYYTQDHYSTFEEILVILSQKESGELTETVSKKAESVLRTTKTPEKWKSYTDWENVAAYLMQYGELPANYISLEEARQMGYSSKKDNLGKVAPEFTIGGGVFSNREGLLPTAEDRIWYECDVDTVNGKRGKHRLLYSSDGLVYLTKDKYKTFVQVEGAEK